ncbi:hypothetical protein N3C_2862 [Clostridium sp. N3C]|uniref:hypothetical protein n=1 Tax=Clostridium sp. N3C TaxID=1776758 RepID=UPI00092E1B17|nr:hypothetical protein [Clostridium sp. N3C]SCN26504.1 hypothetical protein N3C_2862 [Clostridium sp. N3C]
MKNIKAPTDNIWSKQESMTILEDLVKWWDADKHYLTMDDTPDIFGSIPDESRARFRNLVDILSYVIAPALSDDCSVEIKNCILRLIKEFNEYKIPCVQVKASFIKLLNNNVSNVYVDIVEAISSKDKSNIIDAIYAILKVS